MKMARIGFVVVASAFALVAGTWAETSTVDSRNDRPASAIAGAGDTGSAELLRLQAEWRRELDRQLAPVKSEADLADYLSRVPRGESPIDKLSEGSKQRFLESLVFTERGVGSFYYGDLEAELSASEIYSVLSIFGLQSATRQLQGARVESELDRLIMFDSRGKTAYPQSDHFDDYLCQERATCVTAQYYICTDNC